MRPDRAQRPGLERAGSYRLAGQLPAASDEPDAGHWSQYAPSTGVSPVFSTQTKQC